MFFLLLRFCLNYLLQWWHSEPFRFTISGFFFFVCVRMMCVYVYSPIRYLICLFYQQWYKNSPSFLLSFSFLQSRLFANLIKVRKNYKFSDLYYVNFRISQQSISKQNFTLFINCPLFISIVLYQLITSTIIHSSLIQWAFKISHIFPFLHQLIISNVFQFMVCTLFRLNKSMKYRMFVLQNDWCTCKPCWWHFVLFCFVLFILKLVAVGFLFPCQS